MLRRINLTASAILAVCASLAGIPVCATTFGIDAHVPADPIQDEIVSAGIGWVRIDVVWGVIETHRDTFSWDRYDLLIDALESRGLRIFGTLQGTPQWATSGNEFSGVPDDPADWQEFCYLAALRYRGRVDAWGLWNEPNLEYFWQGSRTEYVEEILLPGLTAIAAADPGALMVAPDLAHLTSGHWDDWLERVIRDAGDLFDVIAHHVYPSNGTSGDVTTKLTEDPIYPWDPPSVRSVLDDAGWGDRPFWLTETGVESDLYTEVGQAAFYRGMLERWYGPNRDHDWIDRIFFYEMADPRSNPTLSWGILEEPPDLDRKLAYYEYQDFISGAAVDDAEMTVSGLPRFIGSDQTVEAELTIRNTGTTTWSAADGYGLTVRIDDVGWHATTEQMPAGATVPPGSSLVLGASIRSWFTIPSYPVREVTIHARMARQDDRFGSGARHLFMHTVQPPPVIGRHPSPVVAPFNGTATFSVEVTDPPDVRFQWRRNTAPIVDDHRHAGAGTSQLTVTGIGFDSLGDYDCVVTSAAGWVASDPAALELAGAPIRRAGDRVAPADAPLLKRWLAFRSGRPSSLERLRIAPRPAMPDAATR